MNSTAPSPATASSGPGPALDSGLLPIDLLNTTWRENNAVVDWLVTDEGVTGFAVAHGYEVNGTAAVKLFRASLVTARGLVERLMAPNPASVNRRRSDPALSADVNALLAEARVQFDVDSAAGSTGDSVQYSSGLASSRLRISGPNPSASIAVEAVVEAIGLVEEKSDRIRSCAHEQCTVWFVDTSKGGRRRWCSMERCGNREKARRHYERSTSS